MRFAYINTRIRFRNIDPRGLHFHYHAQVGVAEGVAALGVDCHYFDAGLNLETFWAEKKYRNYDGILGLVAWNRNGASKAWEKIQKEIPCVNLTLEPSHDAGNYVGVDDRAGMRLLFEHIRRRGFRTIGYFGFHLQPYSLRRAFEFFSGVKEYHLECRPGWLFGPAVKVPPSSPENYYSHPFVKRIAHHGAPEIPFPERRRFFRRFLKKKDFPEVLMFETDYLANEFFQAALETGVRIPQDLAITGFDGNHLHYENENHRFLTTVIQDFSETGKVAARLLFDLVNEKGESQNRRILLPPRLSAGKSSSAETNPPDPNDRFRDEAAGYLEKHFADEDLAGPLSRMFGLTPHYFLIKFKKITGKNFTDVANDYRLDKAAFYLAQTSKAVTDIFWETGFRTHQNFNKFFKRRHGLTPSAYRKKHARR